MFRRFAGLIPDGANGLFLEHPSALTTLLEVAWQFRVHDPALDRGHPRHRSNLPQLPNFWLDSLRDAAGIQWPEGENDHFIAGGPVLWDHLIYAYMIENTRIYEIFRRVLHEFLYGEKLGVPLPAAQHWLRNTEELFYRDAPPFFITTLTSHIRSDLRSTRRNAYWRMFGMDLNHGMDDGQPYPYIKADAHNNEFVTTFEEFLREAWVAIANLSNQSGANPTDRGKLRDLVDNLRDMLMTRRVNGNLSREEFTFVAMMSWFHLTLQFNSPIVESLRAEASSPEQRLFKIAQRVSLPAHGLSKSYFDIADPISRILILIEADGLDQIPEPPLAPFVDNVRQDLNTIITHWSTITGRDVKANKLVAR